MKRVSIPHVAKVIREQGVWKGQVLPNKIHPKSPWYFGWMELSGEFLEVDGKDTPKVIEALKRLKHNTYYMNRQEGTCRVFWEGI